MGSSPSGAASPLEPARAPGIAPADLRGAYMGAFASTGAAGFALGPFVGLQIRGAFGDTAMWAFFAAVSVVGAALGVVATRYAYSRARTASTRSAQTASAT